MSAIWTIGSEEDGPRRTWLAFVGPSGSACPREVRPGVRRAHPSGERARVHVSSSTGRHVLGVRFYIEGHDGSSPTGIATLYIDLDPAAELAIKIQPGQFSLAGEGINVRHDAGQPMSSQYTPPFEFTGGTLHQVVLERGDEPFTDLERRMAAAFARD